MRSTRREFMAGAAALVAASGCGLHSSDPVQSFNAGYVAGPSALDRRLVLAMPPDGVAPVTISSFARRTGVHVVTERFHRDDQLMLELAAGQGRIDAALVEPTTLASLVDLRQVEPLDSKLVPGRADLTSPFSDPPYDPGLKHSVPLDYSYYGIVAIASLRAATTSWEAFFRLPPAFPQRVLLPRDPDAVIGAALVAAGHSWDADSDSDLADAEALLRDIVGLVVLESTPHPLNRRAGPVAALSSSLDRAQRGRQTSFGVPDEGTALRVRSWCIPIYAPDPVSANAWLANAIDPVYSAGESVAVRRATPVPAARPLIPLRMLANPAIYPPPSATSNLVIPDISESGRAKRFEMWQDLGL